MIAGFRYREKKRMKPFDKTDDPRRRWLIQALGAGFFSTLPMAQTMAQILGGRPEKIAPGKSIYRIQGAVQVDGKSANVDTPITPTSTIETGRDGELVYVQGNNSYIQSPNSRVVLERSERADSTFAQGLR